MKVSTLPKYGINPPQTKDESKRAEEILKIAEKELKNEPILTPEQTLEQFEEVRQDIINQCRKNGTLNDIE